MRIIKKLIASFCLVLVCQTPILAAQFKVLLFTKTVGWHHESIHDAVTAMRGLSKKHDFDLQWHEDATRFNDQFLSQFDAIVFINTTGNIFTEEQQSAFQRFIQSGKGFVGVHSASDTEYDWEWYGKLVGHYFQIHPLNQTAMLQKIDNAFPGMQSFRERHLWTDEFYNFQPANIGSLNYILTIDESTYAPKADWGGGNKSEGMGEFHPMAWYHEYDGGRSFYTALGHLPAIYYDQAFLDHLYGGIYWAATGKGIEK
ncbi:ThuA domain-containing protein [Glaciecola sp. 2405UD65-10]|uniref:ThuA domain-containing protein n=1 Tax=Glaciecola sp. 2405UD65-10 TaxID=3397244 RepID=UPI003B5A2FD1